MQVEAERFTLDGNFPEETDDMGDAALEDVRDEAGARDLEDVDVVELAGDDERVAEDDRDDDLRFESLDTTGCTAFVAPAAGPIVER